MTTSFENLVTDNMIQPSQLNSNASLIQKAVRSGIKKIVSLVRILPTDHIFRITVQIWNVAIKKLSPEEAIRLFLSLDNELYGFASTSSIDFGKGLHTKHKHLQYEQFFLDHIKTGERVLDVGCSYGTVSYLLASEGGAFVVGIEIDPMHYSQAVHRHHHPNLEFRLGDVLQIEDEQFDVIVLSNVLEHLPHRDTFLRRLQEATQASRYLIRVPMFNRDWRVPLKKDLGIDWRLDPTHETEFTMESFREETGAAGLKILFHDIRWGEIWAELVPA